ncbi:MAG: hypothetical protein HYR64_00825 [Fimbriimonas ginsengisoli]|uniref:Uncharacterized protein n=1 Tax=Fimbriimonas ginsengisoli TaxID=1005039 RepID=A0A931LT10_FIMGI|nr:hypothetical protein [Fimbriimonas ginsengisoli]
MNDAFKVALLPSATKVWEALAKSDPIRYRKVGLCLYKLGQDPRHPSLRSMRFRSLDTVHGEPIWQSYVESKTPACRVFWHYGPDKSEITVVAITPHPCAARAQRLT